LVLVVRGGDGGGFGTVAATVLFSSLRMLSLRLLEIHKMFGVFVWWLFPYDPNLCGGGDGGVRC